MRKQVLSFVVCALTICSIHPANANAHAGSSAATSSNEIVDIASSDMPIPTAVSFAVIFKTPIDTRVAHNGDALQAELKEDLQIGDEIVATAGSVLIGHLEEVTVRRSLYKGGRAGEPRLGIGNRKSVRLLFDQIVTDGKPIKIVGVASKQKINVIGDGGMREILVGSDGELEHSERIIQSGRNFFAAAMPRTGHTNRKSTGADIEEGDELQVQAHSPYESVQVSSK